MKMKEKRALERAEKAAQLPSGIGHWHRLEFCTGFGYRYYHTHNFPQNSHIHDGGKVANSQGDYQEGVYLHNGDQDSR